MDMVSVLGSKGGWPVLRWSGQEVCGKLHKCDQV